jgi:hypothetical protein
MKSVKLPILFLAAMALLSLAAAAAFEDKYTEEARLATEKIGDQFGFPVAIDGNTAVVSSQEGYLVYVFSEGMWVFQDMLIPSDGAPSNCSPRVVDIENDTVVAGCSGVTVGSNMEQGAAYVFVREGTSWSQQQRLTASDGSTGDLFGLSVAISGESVIVGAPRNDVGANIDQGTAYIFTRADGIWSEQAILTPNDPVANRFFGYTVELNDNTAALGTIRTSQSPPPAVYVFVREGTSWPQQTKISICEPSGINGTQCRFGTSGLSIQGDELVVGNSALNVGDVTGAGGVYLFSRSSGAWTQQQRITLPDPRESDSFGNAVSIDGNTLVIGAPAANVNSGTVYAYRNDSDGWAHIQTFYKIDDGPSDLFGNSVAASGNRIIISRSRDNVSTSNTVGAAYIYAESAAEPQLFTVSGRVTDPNGRGISNAVVFLSDPQGERRRVTTNPLGFFNFQNVDSGPYVVSVTSKRYRFASRDLAVTGDISDADFVGQE